MFKKIVIADLTQMAVRIARTCERMGIATVALYGDSDAEDPRVQSCDEAFPVGAGGVRQMVPDAATLVEAAGKTGADAVHPGCGSAAEDPVLARSIAEAGLVYIGPSADLLEVFTDRQRARVLAVDAGVRAVDPEQPITRARRVGVRIAADAATNGVVLGEVECSAVLDYRDLLEESPAPVWAGVASREQKLETLRGGALQISGEAKLQGLGTAWFGLDVEGNIRFERFVAGLPIGCSITELCTGLDLVELQLRLAAGERMPSEALRVQPSGHAMEARLFAEGQSEHDTDSVVVTELRWPTMPSSKLRLETDLAVGAGYRSGPRFSVARIAAHGAARHRSLLVLDRALAETVIKPLRTNLGFLRKILADDSFRTGQYDDTLVARLSGG
jgi:acetyl/propionyl-CoA carboxylase alpha subunit